MGKYSSEYHHGDDPIAWILCEIPYWETREDKSGHGFIAKPRDGVDASPGPAISGGFKVTTSVMIPIDPSWKGLWAATAPDLVDLVREFEALIVRDALLRLGHAPPVASASSESAPESSNGQTPAESLPTAPKPQREPQ